MCINLTTDGKNQKLYPAFSTSQNKAVDVSLSASLEHLNCLENQHLKKKEMKSIIDSKQGYEIIRILLNYILYSFNHITACHDRNSVYSQNTSG